MDYNAIIPKKVRHNEFRLESVGLVIVSTIALPPWMLDKHTRYEVAVIWDQINELDDGYRIMHIGECEALAVNIHEYWCDTTRLAELIVMAVTSKVN